MNTNNEIEYTVEMTDTFGGEANYSWVTRKTFNAQSDASQSMLTRRAKKAIGISGMPCRNCVDIGNGYRLDVVGANVCIFITFNY